MKTLLVSIVLISGMLFNSEHEIFAQEKIAVIISSEIGDEQINRIDLLEIYTMRRQYWEDGARIYVADYKGSNTMRDHFYSFMQIRVNAIKKIWLKEQFTGRSLPPKVVKDADEMLKLVQETPGMIGYIPENMVTEDVKVLITISNE